MRGHSPTVILICFGSFFWWCSVSLRSLRSAPRRQYITSSSLPRKRALSNRCVYFADPVWRLQNLARLRSIRRAHQTIVVHHVDQMSGSSVSHAEAALHQRGARLAALKNQPHRGVIPGIGIIAFNSALILFAAVFLPALHEAS